jgi:N-acetylglutamate synthase
MNMITTLEEISLNAWPSLQTVLYDGWVIRLANGYTRRANSVSPLYFSTMDVDEKIRFCEKIYQERKQDTVFKMTPAVYPENLDERLSVKGYYKDSPTSVQTLELSSVDEQLAPEVVLQEDLSEEWLESFCRMSGGIEENCKSLCQILNNIIPRHGFFSLYSGGKIIACGLGVFQSGFIGLFDIVTQATSRNQGCGQKVVRSILAWGKQNEAQKAYLQVMLNNPPALRLYSKIGFVEEYQYWYRIHSNRFPRHG